MCRDRGVISDKGNGAGVPGGNLRVGARPYIVAAGSERYE